MKTIDIFEMGNENEILAMYKHNSVTEWLQKTGQAMDYVNNGKSIIINFNLPLIFVAIYFILFIFKQKAFKDK